VRVSNHQTSNLGVGGSNPSECLTSVLVGQNGQIE
jgi:hypothetical protein